MFPFYGSTLKKLITPIKILFCNNLLISAALAIKKYTLKKILILSLTVLSFSIYAQDTLRVLSYNLLFFPNGEDFCGGDNINIPNREDSLKVILQYVNPDIFGVCELQNEAAANLILNQSLNVDGITHYQSATFTNIFGDLQTHLFYNGDKLNLVQQDVVEVSSRDIDYYKLQYVNTSAYLHTFVLHLKAGDFADDRQTRQQQCQGLMQYINDNCAGEPVLVMGDFNFYYATEEGFQKLVEDDTNPLFDPINELGNWSENYAYKNVHTQSTRYGENYDCGSGGGLDDRFDFILCSESVLEGTHGFTAMTETYQALGNDGNHYNDGLLWQGNYSLPNNILNALFHTSDHLPVYMEIEVNENVAVESIHNPNENIPVLYYMRSTPQLFSTLNKGSISVLAPNGQTIYESPLHNGNVERVNAFLSSELHQGFYILQYTFETSSLTKTRSFKIVKS